MAKRKAKIGVVLGTDNGVKLFLPEVRARLEKLGEVRWATTPKSPGEAEAIEILRDCTIGLGSWGSACPKSAAFLDALPDLRLWVHVAGSVRHILGPHLVGRKVTIASCKTAIAEVVAEFTLGEIILGLHRVFENGVANRAAQAGWPAHMRSLFGSTIGIIGASEVGRRVMAMLKPFPCKIVLFDPYVTDAQARKLGAERVTDLAELCRRSDLVSLHAPALPATAKMLGAREFRAMRDGTVFINTARAMITDQDALCAELAKGRLFALIDVTEPEPAALDSPLRKLPNVVLTSHVAGAPFFNVGAQAVEDVARFLKGKKPTCVQTPDMADRIG
jgi:phosphoglycerate dehydrogenase-like enzyme